jgi:hypothetical protein
VVLDLLYDDWDRNPYESPFGAIPHDLAVRLFYVGRPARWYLSPKLMVGDKGRMGDTSCAPPGPGPPGNSIREADELTSSARCVPRYVIGRARDVPVLERLGRVELVARGPSVRWDRAFSLFRVEPESRQ